MTKELSSTSGRPRAVLAGFRQVFSVLLFTCLTFGVLPGETRADRSTLPLIINECMINEPGSAVSLEWVELYNRSDETVQLSDFYFVEADDTTRFDETLLLEAGDYAVLSRKPLADPGEKSFEAVWGDNSGVWGDSEEESYLLIESRLSLKNSADSVKLIWIESGISETVSWKTSPPDGISIERINPYKSADPGNFAVCEAARGSTPGDENSILPPDSDLGFVEDSLVVAALDVSDGNVRIDLAVKNFGLLGTSPSLLTAYFDRDLSGYLNGDEVADSVLIPALLPDSIYSLRLFYSEPDGRKQVCLDLAPDDNNANNSLKTQFPIGNSFVELQISEFLVNPTAELGCEWVELTNVADYPISLDSFSIHSSRATGMFDTTVTVLVGERLLVCEKKERFADFYGPAACHIVEPDLWPAFHDSSDLIQIVNDFGLNSDSLRYQTAWSDNRSWERCEDSSGPSVPAFFYRCTAASGSTPCHLNSVPPVLPEVDLLFGSDSVTAHPSVYGEAVLIEAHICNRGILSSPPSILEIYNDRNLDAQPQAFELAGQFSLPELNSQHCEPLTYRLELEAGFYQLIAVLASDDVPENNSLVTTTSVGPETRQIIVTEFIADPAGNLESEWVECRNMSERAVDLTGWFFGDSGHLHMLPGSHTLLPTEYVVITDDSSGFRDYYGGGCEVIAPSGWSNLNNSGDCIRLVDSHGVPSDTVAYSTTVGGNVSLELNEQSTSVRSENWYPSTSMLGATPCERNSVSGSEKSEIEVKLLNRVFAPTLGEVLKIELSLPPATELTIEVFDLAGRKQWTIAEKRRFSSGGLEYAGESFYRDCLSVGAYIVQVKAEDNSGYSSKLGFAVAADK